MTSIPDDVGDATMIAPGVKAGDATVVSQAVGDATVVVSQPGATAAGRLATVDLSQLKPQVEYQLRAHNTYALTGQNRPELPARRHQGVLLRRADRRTRAGGAGAGDRPLRQHGGQADRERQDRRRADRRPADRGGHAVDRHLRRAHRPADARQPRAQPRDRSSSTSTASSPRARRTSTPAWRPPPSSCSTPSRRSTSAACCC